MPLAFKNLWWILLLGVWGYVFWMVFFQNPPFRNYNKGLMMEYEGDFSKAILFYTRALPLAGAYLNRGRLFAERKQFKRAKEDFWAAIKQAKGDTEIRKKAFFNLVLIYLKEGKKKKAKEILKMMVE